MQEKTIKSEKIYSGKLLNIRKLKVKLPNGNFATREIVYHRGAVAIAPIISGSKIIFVKQFRKPAEQVLLEIPAGTIEPKESPLKCAKRELIEETGFRAGKMVKLLEFYPAPGYTTEKIHIFKATELKQLGQDTEPDEFIKIKILSKKQIKKLFAQKKIIDSKTLIALYKLKFL